MWSMSLVLTKWEDDWEISFETDSWLFLGECQMILSDYWAILGDSWAILRNSQLILDCFLLILNDLSDSWAILSDFHTYQAILFMAMLFIQVLMNPHKSCIIWHDKYNITLPLSKCEWFVRIHENLHDSHNYVLMISTWYYSMNNFILVVNLCFAEKYGGSEISGF